MQPFSPQDYRQDPRLSFLWRKEVGPRRKGKEGKNSQSENEEAKDHDKDPTDDVPDILTRRLRRLRRKIMQNSVGSAQQLREAVMPPSVLRIQLSSFLHWFPIADPLTPRPLSPATWTTPMRMRRSPLIPLPSSIFMLCMISVEPSRIQEFQSYDPVLSPELSDDGIIEYLMNWRRL